MFHQATANQLEQQDALVTTLQQLQGSTAHLEEALITDRKLKTQKKIFLAGETQ